MLVQITHEYLQRLACAGQVTSWRRRLQVNSMLLQRMERGTKCEDKNSKRTKGTRVVFTVYMPNSEPVESRQSRTIHN